MENRRPLIRRRWDPFVNQSGETIPPWSCMRMEQTLEGLNAYKPNDELTQQVMFNGPMPVVSGGSGLATFDEPIEAAYNLAEGPPLVGAGWGPVDGEWWLGEGGPGFTCLGLSADGRAMFLAKDAVDDLPDILEILTKVCPAKKPGPPIVLRPSESKVVGASGEYLIDTTTNLPDGVLTITVSLTWKDEGDEAVSGDYFGFKLGVDSTLLDGAPLYYVMFGGISAEKTIEYTWTYKNPAAKPLPLLVYVYRESGSGEMTASIDSKVTVKTETGSLINERRQLILPDGSHLGPKVCVVDPTDCCNDDQSSYTASDLLVVPCCSVPVPSQWKVTLSGVNLPKRGWQNFGYGISANFDTFIDSANEALTGLHILTYRGTAQGFSQATINCVFEKEIVYSNPIVFSRVGFGPVVETDLTDAIALAPHKIVFRLREYVQPVELFFNSRETPYGYVSSPTIRAYAELLIDVRLGSFANVSSGALDMHTYYSHHFTQHFHIEQESGGLQGPEYANVLALLGEGTWPEPMTNCDGPCNLWSPKDRVEIDYGVEPRLENGYPLFATVEPV